MLQISKKVKVWHDVTRDIFENEIQQSGQPAILKGYVNHWPIVNIAKQGNTHLAHYLNDNYVGGKVKYARLKAKFNGLFTYNEAFNGFNFKREVNEFASFIKELLDAPEQQERDTLALQSAMLSEHFPSYASEHVFDLFDKEVEPRIWIGSNAVVAAHYDDAENIACNVAGRRRFTLFPPEQINNLYLGPIDFTPAGAPISLVDFSAPDFNKYPRFKLALQHALVAELEPGDALYIPSLWWHHVQSLANFNILINYWSGGAIGGNEKPSPLDLMLMSMVTIRDLPQHQKNAWRDYFDYYIFSDQTDKYEHIPKRKRSILGQLSEKHVKDITSWLLSQLK
ncbi:cupin-like domain-containing protein [Colwelliaceae bacterium MEBiC 14330]